MSLTIILCAIIFAVSVWAWNSPAIFQKLVHFPYVESRDKSYYRLLTSIFLHGSWLHLLVNLFVFWTRSEEHTSELQSRGHLVCRLLLEKKNHINYLYDI